MHTPHSPPHGGREKKNAPRDKVGKPHAEQHPTPKKKVGAVLLYRSLFKKSIESEKKYT